MKKQTKICKCGCATSQVVKIKNIIDEMVRDFTSVATWRSKSEVRKRIEQLVNEIMSDKEYSDNVVKIKKVEKLKGKNN